MIVGSYGVSENNSWSGVITKFCGEYVKNMLRHNELDEFSLVENRPLHSYYYIGEKLGFFYGRYSHVSSS